MTKAGKQAVMMAITLFGTLIVIAAGALILDVPRYYSLVRNGRPARGIVISKDRENHMSIWFEYYVNDRAFRSAGRADDIGESFYTIQIGDSVPVYYDPSDPACATIGDPSKYLNASIRGTCFILIGLTSCVLIYALRKRTRSYEKRVLTSSEIHPIR